MASLFIYSFPDSQFLIGVKYYYLNAISILGLCSHLMIMRCGNSRMFLKGSMVKQ